eukprot:2392244-Rhodomonas_salina.1
MRRVKVVRAESCHTSNTGAVSASIRLELGGGEFPKHHKFSSLCPGPARVPVNFSSARRPGPAAVTQARTGTASSQH